jgi:hypothetical protein
VAIELYLTNRDARKAAKILRDAGLANISDAIERKLQEQAPQAPWRKIVTRTPSFNYDALHLDLECGHRKTYRGDGTTFNAKRYKRVRCDQCAD